MVIDHEHWKDHSSNYGKMYIKNIISKFKLYLMKCSPVKHLPENISSNFKRCHLSLMKKNVHGWCNINHLLTLLSNQVLRAMLEIAQ